MALIPYTKPHATPTQRVAHLRAKGLIVPKPNVAAKKIELIGYERLRIYFLSRRQVTVAGKPFAPNTSYKDIIRLYECDLKIREAVFVAVGQFELLLRNSMSEALSTVHGSHPYSNVAAFKNSEARLESYRMFVDVYHKSKDGRARHYRDRYGEPTLPPIWQIKEFITFGTASRILKTLSGHSRTAIAHDFGVPKDTIFTQWVECMVDLRNICAHHDRLFNRNFQKQPVTLTKATGNLPTAQPKKLKAILQCLDYMLAKRGVKSDTVAEVAAIIARYPEMVPPEAGY
ncbi:Abi family protein [Rhizobium leguminosarum bv. viciae]|nr:Abi family protein [Rhizobium leguminosarum bv. viciae]